MELDQDQGRAASAVARRLAVVAGAGTGKTRVLVARLVRRIEVDGVKPRRLLAVTFTRKAAAEVLDRTNAATGARPEVRTLHSWAASFLRAHAHLIGRTRRFTVYDDADREELVRLCAQASGDGKATTSRVSTLLNNDRTRRLYYDRLRQGDALDYGLLQTEAVRLLERGQGRHYCDYAEVMVDEAQDLSPLQMRLLTGMGAPLTLVGDPRQAIYGFRGASPRILRGWVDDDDVEVVTLTRNYRSTTSIVRCANAVAPRRWAELEAVREPSQEAIARAASGGTTVNVELRAVSGEGRFIVEDLKRRGGPYGEVAVLARTWRELDAVRTMMALHKIPHRYYGDDRDPWTRSPAGRQLGRLLRLALNPCDDNLAMMLANWGKASRFVQPMALRVEATRERSTVLRVMARQSPHWAGTDLELATGESLAHEVAGNAAEALHGGGSRMPREIRKLIDEILNMDVTLDEWREWYMYGRQEQDRLAEGDHVHLLTIHGSKGLEWGTVYGLGLADGMLPSARTGEKRAEERRLAYVLVTRARDRLVITRPELDRRNQATRWSPFLAEVLRGAR
jgi:superfamily I DNA/RNA helicase